MAESCHAQRHEPRLLLTDPDRGHLGPNDEHHRQFAEEKVPGIRGTAGRHRKTPRCELADVIEAVLGWSRGNVAEDAHRVNR